MMIPHNVFLKEGFERILLDEFQQCRSQLRVVMEDMALYCSRHEIKFIVTDIMSNPDEDKRLGRVSRSHSEGRAFDFRIHGWSKEFLDKFERNFENLYKNIAARSKETGLPNLIVYHDNGNGRHGHCQIKP